MARDGRGEDGTRAEKEIRSDFLRAQMRQWMEQVLSEGKTRDLFELEMWLRAFERFFRIKNQALSDKETRQLALRNWSEELRLVDNVILRTVSSVPRSSPRTKVNQTRFDKYMDGY